MPRSRLVKIHRHKANPEINDAAFLTGQLEELCESGAACLIMPPKCKLGRLYYLRKSI